MLLKTSQNFKNTYLTFVVLTLPLHKDFSLKEKVLEPSNEKRCVEDRRKNKVQQE